MKHKFWTWDSVHEIVGCQPRTSRAQGPQEGAEPPDLCQLAQQLLGVVHVGEWLLGLGDSQELAQRPPALFLELQTKVSSDFTIMEKAPSAS